MKGHEETNSFHTLLIFLEKKTSQACPKTRRDFANSHFIIVLVSALEKLCFLHCSSSSKLETDCRQ